MQNKIKQATRESLATVHTHTHTHTILLLKDRKQNATTQKVGVVA